MRYALKLKIETELVKLEELSIILKVAASEFSTTPILPVLKPTGQVRICEDFKVTVNRYLESTHYPLLQIEEIIERLLGGAVYSILDLPDAYVQMELDEKSKAACSHPYSQKTIAPIESESEMPYNLQFFKE